MFLILNQLLVAGIYVVPIRRICFWFWTNYSLRVYMSFQSDIFVSDSEPTTLCGYISRSNWTHLLLILNQLLFAGIHVVPIGHICFWFWTNYSLRVYMSFKSDTFVSNSEPTTLCGYICRSNQTHLCLILNQLLFALTPYWCLSPGKQQITISWLFGWPDRGLIPRSTVFMFTTAPPTRLRNMKCDTSSLSPRYDMIQMHVLWSF